MADDDASGVVPEGAPELHVPSGAAAVAAGGNGPGDMHRPEQKRLEAVEESVSSLASTLQKEMSLLREALLAQAKLGQSRDEGGGDR